MCNFTLKKNHSEMELNSHSPDRPLVIDVGVFKTHKLFIVSGYEGNFQGMVSCAVLHLSAWVNIV